MGVWVRFLSLRVCRFCLVFEFESCWNWEGRSELLETVCSRNIDDDDDDDDVRGRAGRQAGRPGGRGGSDEEPFGSFESNGNFCSVIRSIIEECPSLFPRVFAFLCCCSCPQTLLLLPEKLVLLGYYYVL